jgi:hypothetical protein
MLSRFLILISFLLVADQSPVQFTVPELSVPSGPTIELPVVVNTNGNIVGSLEFALNYDESILQFTDIIISNKAQEWLTYTMDTGNGKIRWGGYDSSFGDFNLVQDTELFVIKFAVLDQNWNETPITIGRRTAGTELGWDLSVSNTDGYINYNRSQWYDPKDGINGRVYPVPTQGSITLDLTLPNTGKYAIRIIDLAGRQFKYRQQNFFQGYVSVQENLHELPSGLYLLQITNDKFVKSFKIIKK